MSIGRHWKYLLRFSHLYFRINLILMGMLTLERGSAECREGENWRWCCKLNFRAAAWKIQHYTMQELMVHFLQLLVTSVSKLGSFLSLDCNVHNLLKLFLMDWLFYASAICIFTFMKFSGTFLSRILRKFLKNSLFIYFFAKNITIKLSKFSNRKIKWKLNVSIEVLPTNCDRCSGNSWPWNLFPLSGAATHINNSCLYFSMYFTLYL